MERDPSTSITKRWDLRLPANPRYFDTSAPESRGYLQLWVKDDSDPESRETRSILLFQIGEVKELTVDNIHTYSFDAVDMIGEPIQCVIEQDTENFISAVSITSALHDNDDASESFED